MSKPYPSWICLDCGQRYGKNPKPTHAMTMHVGRCGICEKDKIVSEPRDFGHVSWPIKK
jgi:hypothetical protein